MLIILLNLFFFQSEQALDSIPRFKIVYSKIYHAQFVKTDVDYDFELLKLENKGFEKLVSDYYPLVLDLIPIYTGVKWDLRNSLEIYPTRSKISYSHPLTIAYSKNVAFMFFTLIHETVHHNLEAVQNFNFPSSDIIEGMCDKVAAKVAESINDDVSKSKIYSSYYGSQAFYIFDLDSMNVSEWWTFNKDQIELAHDKFSQLKLSKSHKNTKEMLDIFNFLKKQDNTEYREKAYLYMIDYYRNTNTKEAINQSLKYLESYPDGVMRFPIQFNLAEIYTKNNENEKAKELLKKLINSGKEINNYLDDALFLKGKMNASQNSFYETISPYLYIIETLPSSYSKSIAYKYLARIYKESENDQLALSLYESSLLSQTDNAEKAYTIIEMNGLVKKNKSELIKTELNKLLTANLLPELKLELEKILKMFL